MRDPWSAAKIATLDARSDDAGRTIGSNRSMEWHDTPHGILAVKAQVWSDDGCHDEALALIEEALALAPEDAALLAYHGRELIALGRHEEGERSLRKSLDINARIPHAWYLLGDLRQSQDAFEDAASCYEQLVACCERAGKQQELRSALTLLANVQNVFDPEKALENAQRALSIDPTWDEAETIRDTARREIWRRLEEE